MAAWVPCPDCEDYWCTVHQQHAYECPCPDIEEWTTSPYRDDDAHDEERDDGPYL